MKNVKMLLLVLIPLIILAGTRTFAQDREQTIVNMANKLQQKVLLTEDQKNQVVSILRADNSPNMVESQGKIERLLDQRQKAKYEIVKSDWWKALTRELNEKKE